MYCLQWLIPVLLIPKPVNPALLHTHVMFMVLYLIGFFLERKPCTICSLVFLAAVFLICYSGVGNCLLWSSNCDTVRCENGWGWDCRRQHCCSTHVDMYLMVSFFIIIKLVTDLQHIARLKYWLGLLICLLPFTYNHHAYYLHIWYDTNINCMF